MERSWQRETRREGSSDKNDPVRNVDKMSNHILVCFFSYVSERERERLREEVMEGTGSGEVKVEMVKEDSGEGGEGLSAKENVVENAESIAKEDVKLQIEDDPKASMGEETKEEKEVRISEESGEGKENLGGNYQGLVNQLRLEFGKGQQISHSAGIIQVLNLFESFFLLWQRCGHTWLMQLRCILMPGAGILLFPSMHPSPDIW